MGRRVLAVGLVVALALGAALAWRALDAPGAGGALAPGGAKGEATPTAAEPTAAFDVLNAEIGGSARAGDALELRGRVVEHPGAAPMAGVVLRLARGGDVLEARSDADGAFVLASEPRADARLAVEPPPTHWAPEPELAVEGDHWRGAELRVVLVPADRAPFHGRVVDAATGESVPRLSLRAVHPDGAREQLLTDDDGRFCTQGYPRAGTVEVWVDVGTTYFLDSARSAHEHRPARGESSASMVRAFVGPTFPLRIDAPESIALDRLEAFLITEPWHEEPDPSEPPRRIEPDDPPWVRFPPPFDLDGLGPWWIVVRTPGRTHEGRAEVAAGPGKRAAPVAVRLEALATIRGRVLDEDGEPVGSAAVELVRLEGRMGLARWLRSAGNGLFVIRGVTPGRYSLTAVDRVSGACEETIEARAGEELEPVLRLEPFPLGGDVEGTVRSTTGTFREDATVYLLPTVGDQGELTRRAGVEWSEQAGEWVGRFRIEAVPRGEHTLGLLIGLAPYRVEPERRPLAAPASVEFLVRDEEEAYLLRVFAVDEETRDVLDDARFTLRDEGEELVYDGPLDDWPLTRLRASHPLHWVVRAEGYAEARGDRASAVMMGGWTGWRLRVALRRE